MGGLLTRRAIIFALFAIGVASAPLFGQPQPDQKLPLFDVASVKPNTSSEQPANNWKLTPGRTDFHNSQVMQLIKRAWGDFSLTVEGGPGWLSSDRFDVVAQYPPDATPADRDLMLRALLAERFRLSAHLVARETAMYALMLARKDSTLGPQLQPASADCAPTGRSNPPPSCANSVSAGRGMIDANYFDMATFTRALSSLPAVGRRVVDRTGLVGGYKIGLTFAPSADQLSGAPSIFTALQEQLGLKLESITGPIDVLVIDRVERPMSD
jgi:uncharacterized protein (TIGR03435 family)